MKKYIDLSSVLSAVAALSALVALIALLIGNAVPGFALKSPALLVLALVFATVCVVAGYALSLRWGRHHPVVAALDLVALVLLLLVFGNMISQRVLLASSQFTFDSGNALGWKALISSLVSVVACVVSSVLLAVNSFLPDKKN